MDLVTIPQSLLVAYGALVLVCGSVLGVIAARLWMRRVVQPQPEPPELLQARVMLLEQEMEAANAELRRLHEDEEFMRELRPPTNHEAAA